MSAAVSTTPVAQSPQLATFSPLTAAEHSPIDVSAKETEQPRTTAKTPKKGNTKPTRTLSKGKKRRRPRLTPKKRNNKAKKKKTQDGGSSAEPDDSDVERKIKEMQATVVRVRTPGSEKIPDHSDSGDSADDDVTEEDLTELLHEFSKPFDPSTASQMPAAKDK